MSINGPLRLVIHLFIYFVANVMQMLLELQFVINKTSNAKLVEWYMWCNYSLDIVKRRLIKNAGWWAGETVIQFISVHSLRLGHFLCNIFLNPWTWRTLKWMILFIPSSSSTLVVYRNYLSNLCVIILLIKDLIYTKCAGINTTLLKNFTFAINGHFLQNCT